MANGGRGEPQKTNESKLKPCPWRIHAERASSLTVEGEYYYNEYFMPCLGEDCPAFYNGVCRRNIERIIEIESKWIPCKDRLPESTRKSYWVCTDAGSQHECRWTNNRFGLGESDEWGWSIFDIPQYTKVVAWMPLPEPYKEEGENNEDQND